MKITLFTSNQPRHIALVNRLAKVCKNLFVVMECKTVFPGAVQDFFKKTEVMKRYFSHVINAEQRIFGDLSFIDPGIHVLPIRGGDLSLLDRSALTQALQSDIYIVFGSSYIKGWLIDFLTERKALNIHMGVSPYYRGSSCNFWALYDNRPELVGATIHYLSKGLDSGPMLYHALPMLRECLTPFEYTMRAVISAHISLVRHIEDGDIFGLQAVQQNKSLELRYSKHADFTDDVALEFLNRNLSNAGLGDLLRQKQSFELLQPFYY